MILNDGNENDLSCINSSKISYYSHGNKNVIKKKVFLFTNFYYHLIPPLSMVMHWNKFYAENEMIEVGQA